AVFDEANERGGVRLREIGNIAQDDGVVRIEVGERISVGGAGGGFDLDVELVAKLLRNRLERLADEVRLALEVLAGVGGKAGAIDNGNRRLLDHAGDEGAGVVGGRGVGGKPRGRSVQAVDLEAAVQRDVLGTAGGNGVDDRLFGRRIVVNGDL